MMMSMMMPKKTETLTEMLVRTLSGQRGLYVQLLALARQQSQFVSTGETEELMGVLAERSRLIDQVAPLDKELQPFKGRWQEVLDGLASTDRAKVAGLLKEVQQLLADILAQDELDKASLQKQKSEVAVQINRTVTGAALAKAYGRK